LAWDLPEEAQHSLLDDEGVAATKLSASVKKDKKTHRRKKEVKRKTAKPKIRGDLPGKIKRAHSQDVFDILMKMRHFGLIYDNR
jgi:hypothetical protein